MERFITRTIDSLHLEDAARGVWDLMIPHLAPALRSRGEAPLLAAAERAARGVALGRQASIRSLLEGYVAGCDALAGQLARRGDAESASAADRLADLRPRVLLSIAEGYVAGLEDAFEVLERQAEAASPVDELTGAMKPAEIAERLAVEMTRCRRTEVALGVAEMTVDIDDDDASRERLAQARRDVGECLRGNLRSYDSVGLTGRGGFVVVLPDVSRRGLASAAERLQREAGECSAEDPRLVLALAHYEDVDVGAGDVLVSLQRGADQARERGDPLAWV